MRKLSGLIVSSILAVSLFGACGGDGGTPVQAPQTPGESPTLDFASIAGAWAGWAVEASSVNFWMRADLRSRAGIGATVGTIEYGIGDPGNEPECGGDWIAVDAENPVFTVAEKITFSASGGCPNGTVRLELDPEAGTLSYDFKPDTGGATAEGTLMRGTDPGPRP